jgi:hypothetical protein
MTGEGMARGDGLAGFAVLAEEVWLGRACAMGALLAEQPASRVTSTSGTTTPAALMTAQTRRAGPGYVTVKL